MDIIYIYLTVLPYIKEKARKIDALLIESLFENKDKEIVNELSKYQNEDGGFGNNLEIDLRMDKSSIAASVVAIKMLNQVFDFNIKRDIISKLVKYLENNFDSKTSRFPMVTKEVEQYKKAEWWNYNDLNSHFNYGNPESEIIGFLYQNKEFLTNFDLDKQIKNIVNYINGDKYPNGTIYELISTLYFYRYIDKDTKDLIKESIQKNVDNKLSKSYNNWDKAILEPHNIFAVEPEFIINHQYMLYENIDYNKIKLENMDIHPKVAWHQDIETYNEIKNEWYGPLFYSIIKAIFKYKKSH